MCFARGQVGSFGFQKVGASGEGQCVQTEAPEASWPRPVCGVLDLGTLTHARVALAIPRSKGRALVQAVLPAPSPCRGRNPQMSSRTVMGTFPNFR